MIMQDHTDHTYNGQAASFLELCRAHVGSTASDCPREPTLHLLRFVLHHVHVGWLRTKIAAETTS